MTLEQQNASEPRAANLTRYIAWLLLGLSAVFFGLHFLHLTADFPNNSPWVDWSKYTDEGWYGDAAIRHYLFGHWYFQGDFNPSVALPIWPGLELIFFKFTGVSISAARSLTLVVFAVTLFTFYRLIERHARPPSESSGPSLAAPLAVFFLCTSPFLFVFERMAILEPLLIALTALAILTASHLHPLGPGHRSFKNLFPSLCLTLLIPAAILTKTTAVFLFPAVFYMVWARAGYRILPALRFALPPLIGGLAIWCAYFFLFVRPHYLADYQYLFSANGYTGIELEPLATVVLNTLSDGLWMGHVLYVVFFAALLLTFFWRPKLLANPLVPSLLLWILGYFAFLAYHNNLQPRYYLVVAVPITVFVAIALDAFRQPKTSGAPFIAPSHRAMSGVANSLAAIVVLGIVIPDTIRQIDFLRNPTYDFEAAAQSIKQIIVNDHTHPHLLLSISGSDLTLMTGLPSIDDDFGTDVEDDKADAINPLYNMERIAAFPAMDDPDRNLLILYRLDPKEPTPRIQHAKRHTPKPLVTKLGQQPSVDQLEH
jgi:hypothetical protein